MSRHLDTYRQKLAKSLARATPDNAEDRASAALAGIGDDEEFSRSLFEANVLSYLAGQLLVAKLEVPETKKERSRRR